jgi:shikimate dehydrogenase
MKHFAVIGNPIAHSRSPDIHRAFATQTGVALQYEKLLAPMSGFKCMVEAFFAGGGDGMNVTVPFKEDAYLFAEVLTERAQAAGAVNTLWMKDGLIHGDNTDGAGLVNAISDLGWSFAQARVLILGAGGATRGVILPLIQAGVREIMIANRTVSRAQQLIEDMAVFGHQQRLSASSLLSLSGHFDIIINATSASLSGDDLNLPKDLSFAYAYEMAYGKPSHFLDQARARGAVTAEGMGMLAGQAAESFLVWNGVKPSTKGF